MVEGLITSKQITGKIKVDQVNLTNFEVPESVVAGYASLEASISGALNQPFVKGELWGSNLFIYGAAAENFRAQLIFKDGVLTLAPMVIKVAEDSMIDGFFSMNLMSGKILGFKLGIQRLSSAVLADIFPQWLSVSDSPGTVSGSIAFDGKRRQNYWEFSIDAHKLLVKDQEVASVFLEGNILGNQGENKKSVCSCFWRKHRGFWQLY